MSQVCFLDIKLPLKRGHFSIQDTKPQVARLFFTHILSAASKENSGMSRIFSPQL